MAGDWEGTFKLWFEAGDPACESRQTGSILSILGGYGDGQGGPDWGWRTEIEQTDADTLVIVMTNIMPQGEEVKPVETRYKRKRSPSL